MVYEFSGLNPFPFQPFPVAASARTSGTLRLLTLDVLLATPKSQVPSSLFLRVAPQVGELLPPPQSITSDSVRPS